MYDIIIIGGGVIGSLTARELSRYKLKICILEKSSDIATGASGANSGIIHAGYDAEEGSLKAHFNVLGSEMMQQTAEELGVKYKNNGSIVVAVCENDCKTIDMLYERGLKNNVKDLQIIDRKKLKELEPNISGNVIKALYAKSGGIICPYGLTIAACGNAMDNGAELKLNFKVNKINQFNDYFEIISDSFEKVKGRIIINAAGINSDKIANMIGDYSFNIHSRKGEYILLDKESGDFVSHTMFKCPDEKGKGVLVTNTVDGNILLGPTSVLTEDKEDKAVTKDGFNAIIENAKKIVNDIPLYNTITSFAGVRSFCDKKDFIISESEKNPNFINVAGIESPGLSASPAISKYVKELIIKKFNNAKRNEDFNERRIPFDFFKKLNNSEKNEIIKKNASFGKIICRCEEVTMGEILFELNRNPKPNTLDGIKRRTRAGMGRCQSGFCQPYLMEILKNKLKVNIEDITKSGGNSNIITGRTK